MDANLGYYSPTAPQISTSLPSLPNQSHSLTALLSAIDSNFVTNHKSSIDITFDCTLHFDKTVIFSGFDIVISHSTVVIHDFHFGGRVQIVHSSVTFKDCLSFEADIIPSFPPYKKVHYNALII